MATHPPSQSAPSGNRPAGEGDRPGFLAVLAHELRNPLAPLRNAIHVLRLRGTDPATVDWATGVLERQVAHLTRLVDDLLDVSRLERGLVRLRRERLDLTRLVRAAADDHRPALRQAGLALELDLPPMPLWVEGDATRLDQVLDNLLDNACRFTPAGGRVSVYLGASDGWGRVSVRDTGIGIAPELLAGLFEALTQADRSLERSPGGLGLGLVLTRGLVELHGGTVEARSDGPGQGAEFTFQVPLAQAGPEAALAPAAAGQGRRLRILMVEDHRDGALTLQTLLQLAGHEVALACTGPEGVALAHQFQPDVVLCDLGLPGMDGFAVGRALRRDPVTAGSRLIVLSGYGQEEDRRKSREAGFDLHLTKPVDPLELQRVLAG